MRYLLSTAGPARAAFFPPAGSSLLSSRAPFCWPSLIEPCSHSVFSRDPGPLCRRSCSEEASPYPHPKKNLIKHPAASQGPQGGGKRILLPPLLNSTSSWLWKIFFWVHHQSWKGFGSPPCSHLLFVFCFRHTLSSDLL